MTLGRLRVQLAEEELQIREFRMPDLDPILALLPRCFAREFEVSGMDPAHVKEMANRAYGIAGRFFLSTSRLVGKEPFKFLVATWKNEVVGTAMVSRRATVGYISTVMVSPDYRRKGIATKLMNEAFEYIRERGMKRAVLHVISTNEPAKGVYSKLGFAAFEEISYQAGDVSSLSDLGRTNGVEARPFASHDLDDVYDLQMASEDSNHMRVFGLRKSQLKTSISERLFRFSTRKTIVAIRAGKVVGSVFATYATAKEAGTVGSVQVSPENRSTGIEKVLIGAAMDEIRKGGVSKVVATVPTTRPEVIQTLNDFGFREAMKLVGMSREI
jgi:ribosomal protein S18 acetylase RimI-like enzyme